MPYRGWWLRLLLLQWTNAWRSRPVLRSLILLLWLAPVVLLPALLVAAGHAAAAREWLLSLDVPLALMLASHAGAAVAALRTGADAEAWVMPAGRRGVAGRLLGGARLLHALRWPLGLLLASGILMLGAPAASHQMRELAAMVCMALLLGALIAWLMTAGPRASSSAAPAASRARGLAALSWVPFQETRRQLSVRRLSMLAMPVLLSAPMGARALQILLVLLALLPLVHLLGWYREGVRASAAIRRWLPFAPVRLHARLWRHVLLATLLGAAAALLAWRSGALRPGLLR